MTIGVQQLMAEVERIATAFHDAMFTHPDVDAALALTAADCVLVHRPAGTGAAGAEALHCFLAEQLQPHLPTDLGFTRLSRTVDRWQLVEESTVSFTHDRALPWLLPGLAPTGHPVRVLAISIVGVRHGRVTSHRTLWDHAGLLAQLTPA